jgi:hypothetical protein
MALLDLQDMEWSGEENGDSDLSVTVCNAGASSLSVALCDID